MEPKNSFFLCRFTAFLFLASLSLAAVSAFAQDAPSSPSSREDYIVFTNGEKLIGRLERSTGDTVLFKSDMAGEVKVKWSQIKELHSPRSFAVVEKGITLHTNESDRKIPQGSVAVADGSVTVSSGPQQSPMTLPLSDTADLIDQSTFSRVVLSRPAWYENWKGEATLGVAIVQATQTSRSYTSAANFVRDIPGENWMEPESRTSLNFTSSYGQLTQPNAQTLKTSIFHAEAERDRYFSPKGFAFLNAQFDHDYSQGLDLQQIYSIGVGYSAIQSKYEQLDLRTAIGYQDQQFFDSTQNQNLVSSIFSESYNRKFTKAILHQGLSVKQSWSNLNAYSVAGDITFTVPIVKRISFTWSIIDNYLNNPSPNFKKNSFQFSSGITYSPQGFGLKADR